MKMLKFVAVVALLAASTVGCKSGNCFNRGASCPSCGQQPAPPCGAEGCYGPQGGGMGMPSETFAPGPA